MKFSDSQITDQKRLVRGEHLLYARSRLRVRDSVHHRKWRVLILAGGAPSGEITALRELMPQCHITAVDRDPSCLVNAIEAGADEVIQCDIAKFTDQSTLQKRWHGRNQAPPVEILAAEDFDLIDLDLCSNVNPLTRDILATYRWKTTSKGLLMLTFSYGRDVEELFHDAWTNKFDGEPKSILKNLEQNGIPQTVCGRIAYLCTSGLLDSLHSVMLYRGATMPMCALLFQPGISLVNYPSVVKVEPGDYELAVVYPDAMNLYATQRERIESLRRSFAAIKAAYTRMEKTRRAELLMKAN